MTSQQRDLACELARKDLDRALSRALAIRDPWFACQALASVGRFAPEQQFPKIIERSLHVVRAELDPYRVVAPSAWPIRAIVERHRSKILPSIMPELLLRAEDIELLVSRSEALFLVFQAVFPASREYWFPVLDSLRQASKPLISWRQKRNLADAIMIVRSADEPLALEMYDAVEDQKLKNKITKMWAKPEQRRPREFFW